MLELICVDPHPAVRAGVEYLLRDDERVRLVASADSLAAAMDLLESHLPDIVLIDPEWLTADALTICRRLKTAPSKPGVVVYTALAKEPGLALQARIAGADGLVDKAAPIETLVDAVHTVGAGGITLPPLDPVVMEAAAQRVDPQDLALLAMLADRTPPEDVAATLRLDPRGLGRRVERMLPRLRTLRRHAA